MYYWYVVLAHVALAFCLFLLVNWFGSKAGPLGLGYVQISLSMQVDTAPVFNYLFKVLAPVVFMILLYAFFQKCSLDRLNSYIYWVVIDYWLIRFIITILKERLGLVNWIVQFLYWISSIGLAVWVYSLFDKTSVLPSPASLVEQLWLVIILFLYSVLNKVEPSRKKTELRINRYITKRYLQFRIDYEHLLNDTGAFQKAVLYSIMIFEDFNRPRFARFLEKILYRRSTNKHTYGIMQVTSNRFLTDEESIVMAIERIQADLQETLKSCKIKNLPKSEYKLVFLAQAVAQKYNPGDPDYGHDVGQVFEILYSKFYSPKKSSENKVAVFL